MVYCGIKLGPLLLGWTWYSRGSVVSGQHTAFRAAALHSGCVTLGKIPQVPKLQTPHL